MLRRQPEWSTTCVRQREPIQRRRMSGVWQARERPTGRDSGRKYIFGSVGRIWIWGWWHSIYIHRTGMQREGDVIGGPQPPTGIHTRIRWLSWPPGTWGTDLSRNVGERRICGRQCRSTFITSMSGITWLYWGRGTPPTHGVPSATCWWPGKRWTGGTSLLLSAPRGQIESSGIWRKRIFGRVQREPFRPTEDHLRRLTLSNTWGRSWRLQTTTGWQWWGT